jgi:hypothetical protein
LEEEDHGEYWRRKIVVCVGGGRSKYVLEMEAPSECRRRSNLVDC